MRRRGTSLVEVLIGVGILAGCLVPVAWYFVNSGKQQADLKAEAVAAGFAGKLMNELLTEVPFDDLGSDGGSPDPIDGVEIQWTSQVGTVDPSAITFVWEPLADNENDTGSESADKLDAKFRGRPALKDIMLTIQWKGPRHDGWDDPRRTQVMVTRRARL